jgi:hypothetical protein
MNDRVRPANPEHPASASTRGTAARARAAAC